MIIHKLLAYILHTLSLLCQLLNIDLGGQIPVRSDGFVVASQLFKGLEILISEGVGTDRAEWRRRSSTGGEELVGHVSAFTATP